MNVKKNASMKVVILLLVVVLLIGCVAGGTLAWLITNTNPVVNTFVAGEIGTLTLTETETTSGADNSQTKNFTIVPGVNITKDPKVTFSGNNIPAYVFVEIKSTGWTTTDDGKNFSIGEGTKQVAWEVAEGWIKLENGVYYRLVDANATNTEYPIIKGNTITVGSGITKEDLATTNGANQYLKSLTFTAYAIQSEGFVDVDGGSTAVQQAWAALNP